MDSGAEKPADKSLTVAKLCDELAAHGLSETGKKPNLYRRFTEALERECAAVSRPDSPEVAPGDEIEAVVYECFPYDDAEGLIDTASTTLKVGAEPDKLTVGNDPERIAVGNPRGLGLLERLAMFVEATRGP